MEAMALTDRLRSYPGRVKDYVQELQTEMKRVTWPSRKQVQATTAVVIISVFAFAAYFALVDVTLGRALTALFRYFAK